MPMKDVGCRGCQNPQSIPSFTMAFQPVVDLDECRIDAHEALVRGPNGEGAASILAGINSDNLYTFDQACRVKAIEMATELGIDCQLNINFLPNAVYQPAACIRLTLDAATRTGFPLDRMTFEIVESEEMTNTEHLQKIIAEYRRHGFKVAMDDFSSGYSGLLRLADLRPDIVKLDRLLIKDCHLDSVRLAIAAKVIALCAEIGIKVVIEGVELLEEVDALRAAGGRFMQGFYFSKPLFQTICNENIIPWPARNHSDRPQTEQRAAILQLA